LCDSAAGAETIKSKEDKASYSALLWGLTKHNIKKEDPRKSERKVEAGGTLPRCVAQPFFSLFFFLALIGATQLHEEPQHLRVATRLPCAVPPHTHRHYGLFSAAVTLL
jgi:hypothetical protein